MYCILTLLLWNFLIMPFKMTWLCPWCPDSAPDVLTLPLMSWLCPWCPDSAPDVLTLPLMSWLCPCEMSWISPLKRIWLSPWCPYCAPVKCPHSAPVKCPDCAPGKGHDYAPGENWPDREPVVVMQGGERVKWLKGPECRRTTPGRGSRFLLSSLLALPSLSCQLEYSGSMCCTKSRKT